MSAGPTGRAGTQHGLVATQLLRRQFPGLRDPHLGEPGFVAQVFPAESARVNGLQLDTQGLGGVAVAQHEPVAEGEFAAARDDHAVFLRAGQREPVDEFFGRNGGHGKKG